MWQFKLFHLRFSHKSTEVGYSWRNLWMTQYMWMSYGQYKHISATQKSNSQTQKCWVLLNMIRRAWDLQKWAMLCFEQILISQKLWLFFLLKYSQNDLKLNLGYIWPMFKHYESQHPFYLSLDCCIKFKFLCIIEIPNFIYIN